MGSDDATVKRKIAMTLNNYGDHNNSRRVLLECGHKMTVYSNNNYAYCYECTKIKENKLIFNNPTKNFMVAVWQREIKKGYQLPDIIELFEDRLSAVNYSEKLVESGIGNVFILDPFESIHNA
jgi:hypothetical protein